MEETTLADALAQPGVLGSRDARVEVVETHISRVYLTGDRALKVRKPVRTSFLDYRTPADRLRMSREEVRLGRRLAPTIYRGVRSIVEGPGGYRIAEEEEPSACDYAVEMRRFDPGATLAAMLDRGEADASLARRMGAAIAAFHTAQPALPGRWPPATVAAAVYDNFADLLGTESVTAATLRAGQVFASAFLHRHAGLLSERSLAGRARDGHGDLRSDHVVVEGESIEIFDPLEFSPELRETDVAADLAFLVMDLHRALRPELADALVAGYREAGGDPGPDELLYFYAAYRAWVRAKVAAVRAHQADAGAATRDAALSESAAYAAVGERMAWRAREPEVLVVCGTAATGKSTLAAALAERSGLAHLSSDVVRKRLAGVAPQSPAPEAAYDERVNRLTYSELGRLARGHGRAIVDATFRFRRDRDAFREGLGTDHRLFFIECLAPLDVVRTRAEARAGRGGSISDAGAAIALRQREEFDPLDEVPANRHVALRSDAPVDQLAPRAEEALDLAVG